MPNRSKNFISFKSEKSLSYVAWGISLCIALLAPTISDAATCAATRVTVSALNVRTGPSTNNAVVGEINQGEIYVKTGRVSGSWSEIWFNDAARWIFATNYTANLNTSCGTVTATSLNVRSGASTNYRIVGTASKNSQWAVIANNGSWRQIWFASEARWVHGSYLDQSVPVPLIELTAFNINANASSTDSRFVSAYSSYASSAAAYYRISENANFSGATWKPYSTKLAYTLSDGPGIKTVYFQIKNDGGRLSNVRSDTITYNPPPPPPAGYAVNRSNFYSQFRAYFGGLNQSQVDGINYLLTNMENDKRPAINSKTVWMRQIAYIFSTTKHEVANTYKPITEYSNTHCVNYDGGCLYKGRGYVQLTHRYNYQKMSPVVGVDLVANPTRALEPNIAYTVMSYGMFNGSFTGKALGSYIKSGTTDYYNARRVVNGLDRASLLQGYANSFQTIMERSTINK